MPLFKRERTLTEIQDEDERLEAEIPVAKKRALLAQLTARAGKGSWKPFSSNGTLGGVDWKRVWIWLKTH